MKRSFVLLMLFSSLSFTSQSASQDGFPALETRYMGLEPPGLTPKLFAPGIVSTKQYLETEVVFLSDMTQLSFTRNGRELKTPQWIVMQHKEGKWLEKAIAPSQVVKYFVLLAR
ncbi:hypothetical protein [Pseudoalteromonas byunsanensis]|uniref:Uncharacterized protein n=1 Tax=Pseudoalteromonas byunsanensis TaxID=327939 RepID=A0A1S1N8I1_9GAMM|nr:hypothetical protein [Pseudoalteromonas byunsanensis]OHU95966.1 hypothetical protein BIW53_09185 [Pseudoalteromonas byunsanensis]